ncbi:MAG: MraY family glycosyltransferase [Clostridia bacterium]
MSFFLTFLFAFAVSIVVYPLVKKVALRSGAISVPHKDRHIHEKPIPLLGGLSIIIGFGFSILMNYLFNTSFVASWELIGLAAGIVIIMAMGILDDIHELKPSIKALFQIAAAVTAILISGSRFESFTNPTDINTVIILPPVISFLVTIFWIFALTNAFNLVDGLDGLAGGTGAICALTLFVISLIRPDAEMVGSYVSIVLIALAGGCLGFLPFNFNPAKIFMGESGSAFIGFTLALVSIQGTLKSYAALSLFIPIIAFGLPILDIILAFLRRIIKRRPVSQGDRQHIHHRLIDMGLSQKNTVLILYSASILLGIFSILLAGQGMQNMGYLLIILLAIMIMAVLFLYIPSHSRKGDSMNDHEKN